MPRYSCPPTGRDHSPKGWKQASKRPLVVLLVFVGARRRLAGNRFATYRRGEIVRPSTLSGIGKPQIPSSVGIISCALRKESQLRAPRAHTLPGSAAGRARGSTLPKASACASSLANPAYRHDRRRIRGRCFRSSHYASSAVHDIADGLVDGAAMGVVAGQPFARFGSHFKWHIGAQFDVSLDSYISRNSMWRGFIGIVRRSPGEDQHKRFLV